jgi:hypothetical protein
MIIDIAGCIALCTECAWNLRLLIGKMPHAYWVHLPDGGVALRDRGYLPKFESDET